MFIWLYSGACQTKREIIAPFLGEPPCERRTQDIFPRQFSFLPYLRLKGKIFFSLIRLRQEPPLKGGDLSL